MQLRTGAGDHTRSKKETGKKRQWPALVATAAAVLMGAAAIGAPTANAGVMDVAVCRTEDGIRTGSDGWTSSLAGAAWTQGWSKGRALSCEDKNYVGMELRLGEDVATQRGRYTQFRFTAPSNTTISRFWGHEMYSVDWWGDPGSTSPYWFRFFFNEAEDQDNWFESRQASNGTSAGGTWHEVNVGGNNARSLTARVECSQGPGNCTGPASAVWMLERGTVTLRDVNAPTVTGSAGGSLVAGQPLTGNAAITYTANDLGVGLYRTFILKGDETLSTAAVDTNNGKCVTRKAGAAVFADTVPCKLNASASATLNTASLTDGTHPIVVQTEDASGNRSTVWSGTIVTDNKPLNTTKPAVSVTAKPTITAGAVLVASRGSWDRSPTAFTYEWSRCEADGSRCVTIPNGSAAERYTVQEEDAYHALKVTVRASNASGAATVDSALTTIVPDVDGNVERKKPEIVTAPAVSGSARVGARISVGAGSWRNLAAEITTTYQWVVNGQAVPEATSVSFVPTVTDAYKELTVVVTARNRHGATSTTVAAGTIADAAGRTAEPREETREGEQERPPTPPTNNGGGVGAKTNTPPPSNGGGTPPAPVGPAVGQPNGTNAGPRATVTATFAKGRKKTTINAGKATKISGRVVNSSTRRPIGGAALTMVTTAPGRKPVSKTIKTKADGTFAVTLSKKATSASIAFQYRERVGGATAASTKVAGEAKVSLSVRSKLSWKASSSHRVLKFTGTVSTPGPTKGKQYLEVQWKRGKSWATLAHPVAINKKGAFTLKYPVGSNVRTGQRFAFRVAVRIKNGSWPYVGGATKAKLVQVR